jgi:hypothetical protein
MGIAKDHSAFEGFSKKTLRRDFLLVSRSIEMKFT